MSQFHFKQFSILQTTSAMKVTLDACLFAAYIAKEYDTVNGILDLGMGTGLLGLMLAQAFETHVEGVELDDNAHREALENIKASPFYDRVTIHQADIRTWQQPKEFELIVSNPPFYSNHMINPNQKKAMARHNQCLPFTDLLACISQHLSENGQAWILIPTSELDPMQTSLKNMDLVIDKYTWVRSKGSKPPHRVFIRLAKQQTLTPIAEPIDVENDDICIHGMHGYDARFEMLLKPYYLKL